jgi:hydroxyacylglutathione hydrolase
VSLLVETFAVGPLNNNLYLLRAEGGDELIVVDPSLESDAARERVHQLHDEARLAAVWNTHAHFDHIYDNATWQREWDVPIWMHPDDRFWVERLREQSLWLGFPAPAVVFPNHPFQDGQVVHIGEIEAQVLCVPGHSPGSVAFWFPTESLCISGDVIFRGSVGRTDLPGCSTPQLMNSIRRLVQMLPPETRLLPGHGEATTLAEELRSNPFLQDLEAGDS